MAPIKKLSLITALFFCHHYAPAQGHIPQTSAVHLSFGKSTFTTIFSGGYTYFLSPKTFIYGQANYEYGEDYLFKFQSISSDWLANHSLINLNGNFYFNIGAGLSLAYERLQPDAAKGFNYGALIKAEAETFITDAISIGIWADQSFLTKKDIGNLRYRYGLGIKLFL
ncbi:MAG: hypothetical protein E6Q85_00455 [Thiothrix sp.]|nr:MAG: hypothetical protein E6Q85_00455 [Thiothrix sp.]